MLKEQLGIGTQLIEGGRGEFTVTVDGTEVARKNWLGFPKDEKILEVVKDYLAR